jgi:hypothetical protein
MRLNVIVIVLGILVLLSFCAGCAETPSAGGSPTATVPSTTTIIPFETGISLTPGPTETMPAGKEVIIQVQRDQIQPTITVEFRGGAGQQQVRMIEVRMTTSTGIVQTQVLCTESSKCLGGDNVTFVGTRGKDRIEGWVTLITNERFKILDGIFDFYAHA